MEISERLHLIEIALLIVACTSFIAYMFGFYRLPVEKPSSTSKLLFRDLLGVFAFFLFIELVLVPAISYLWISFQAGKWLEVKQIKIDSNTLGWLNLLAIFSSAVAILGFTFMLPSNVRKNVWRPSAYAGIGHVIKDVIIGFAAWLISYPLVIAVSQLIVLVMSLWLHFPHADQVAVRQLKMTVSHPFLFWTTIVAIVFVVPVVEEILFRGFLQTWIKGVLGRTWGILLASCIFASFHYSQSQGWDNIELLCSLFILSCFLGFVYERQNSLWASIGLHVIFNAVSIFMILK